MRTEIALGLWHGLGLFGDGDGKFDYVYHEDGSCLRVPVCAVTFLHPLHC